MRHNFPQNNKRHGEKKEEKKKKLKMLQLQFPQSTP